MISWPSGAPDDLGIIRCTDAILSWSAVPSVVADISMHAREPSDIMSSMLDGPRRWPASLQRRLLHPASGVPAVLAPVRKGTSALDLGTGWFGLAPALAALGANVTRTDWVYSRLRFANLMHPVPGGVDVLVDLQLQPATARFDVVFLDLDTVSPGVVPTLLSSAAGHLRPGGTIVAGASERKARYVRVASFARALRTPSLRALARKARLEVHDTYAALPDRVAPTMLVPRSHLAEQIRAHRQHSGAKAIAVRLALALGGAPILATDRYVVLAPTGKGTGRGLAAELLHEGRPPLVLPLSDARAGVLGRHGFVKISLSADQRRALVAEAKNTKRARATAFAPHVVEPLTVSHMDGTVSVTYPTVHGRSVAPERAPAVIDAVLGKLDRSRTARLDLTPLWHRLTSVRGQRDIADLGAGQLWKWLDSRCRRSAVPVGPNHGDLHRDNVLVREGSGDPVLVDWNRYEDDNPLFLDPLYAAIHVQQSVSGCSFAEGVLHAGSGALTGQLAVRAQQLRGDLDALEAATLVLLDRVASYSLPRRRFKPWTLAQFEEAVVALEPKVLAAPTHPERRTRPRK